MGLVWTESFVGWSTPVGIYQSCLGAHAPGVAAGPNGQNVYVMASGQTLVKTIPSTPATIGVGVRFKSGGEGSGPIILILDGATEQFRLEYVPSTGQLGVPNIGASPAGTILPGVWYYITLDATIHPTAGSVVVKVNGLTVINGTGVTRHSATSQATALELWAINETVTVCDWYITDGVAAGAEPVATIGDVRIVALRPSGAGSLATFAPSAGANWQNVDDAPGPDDDATYNASSNPTDRDSFVTPGLGAVFATTIPAVFVKSYARKDDAGARTLAGFVKLGASTEEAAGTSLSAGYAWQADKFPLDPAGNPWTKANVNAAEFGYDLIA